MIIERQKADLFTQRAASNVVYLANLSLWFMIHKVVTLITVELS